MKLFNSTSGKKVNIKTVPFNGSNMYPENLTDEQLNSVNLHKFKHESQPSRRYYTSEASSALVDGVHVTSYTAVDKNIDDVRALMLKDLSEAFIGYSARPKVDTGLDYFVDGGRDDLQNFEIGRESGFPFIVDAYDEEHPATDSDYATVIQAIKDYGISLFQMKRNKKTEIKALTSVAGCEFYEATPYDEMADVVDEATLEPTGEQELRTLYRNNVKDWQ